MNRQDKESGFTLVELIAVIVLLSILSVVSSRVAFFSGQSSQVQTSRDDVIAALFFAQQIAMARASATNSVEFIFTANQISVEEDGTPMSSGGVNYPLTLNNGVVLTSTLPSPLTFDKLGRSTAATLTLTSGTLSAQIQLSASGYAY